MQANLTWLKGVQFSAKSGSGHEVMMDGAPEFGGENQGARPMELVLMGLLGCSSFDVVQVLKKARQDVDSCEVFADAERADETPAVFTKIELKYVIKGRNLKRQLIERAVALSAKKYCSASIMLERGGVEINHIIEVIEVD